MPTIEISGVGDVEVDDSFLQKTPEEQQAIVDGITAQVRGGHAPRGASTRAILEATLRDAFPDAKINGGGRSALRNSEVGGAQNSYHLDDEALDIAPIPGVSIEQMKKAFADRGIPLNEALYHSVNGGKHYHLAWDGQGGNPTVELPEPEGPPKLSETEHPTAPLPSTKKAPRKPFGSDWQAFLMGSGDSASFGTLDAIYANLGAVIPGLANANMWDGKHSFSDAVDLNKMDAHGMQDELAQDHWKSSLAGSIAGGLVPLGPTSISLGTKALKYAKEGATAAKVAKGAAEGAITGGAYSGLYGFGNSRGDLSESALDGLSDVPMGMALGGALGTVAPIASVIKQAKLNRFVKRQSEKNPFAKYDAEFVDDLSKLTTDRALSPLDPKGRAKVTVKDVNNLEQSYQGRFKDMLNGLDISPEENLRLKAALDSDYTMSKADVDALRGTPQGDAVADAITMTQRIRALTPEIKRSNGLVRAGVDAATTGVGAATYGPLGAFAGRGLTSIFRRAVDGEAARVNSAEKLLKKAGAYKKLQEAVGPSGARESREGLWQAYGSTKEAEAAEQAAKAAEQASKPTAADRRAFRAELYTGEPAPVELATQAVKRSAAKARALTEKAPDKLAAFDEKLAQPIPEAPITRADRQNLRSQITDPTVDPRDLANQTPTEARLAARIRARDAAIAKLERTQAGFDQKLATPLPEAPAPKAKPMSAADQAIEDNIAKGLQGTSRVQDAFAERLGVPKADMLRALDAVASDVPELAGDIARIKNGYATQTKRGLADVLVPRMKAHLDADGTLAKIKTQADEAKKLAEARKALAAQAPKPQAVPDDRLPTMAGSTPRTSNFLPRIEAPEGIPQFAEDGSPLVSIDTSSGRPVPSYGVPDQPGAAQFEKAAQTGPLEGAMRPVYREKQHTAAKGRNIKMATDVADNMFGDPRISQQALNAMNGVSDRIIHSFKTRDEALDFFDKNVVPDIQMSGGTAQDIDAIREHIYQMADIKPYKTPADLEAGTAARPRGRPPKN